MNPRSEALFHFTRNVETLLKILEHGFWPRYCQEDIGWLNDKTYEFISYPMVCFCDIPLSRIKNHQEFYGKFGIGMTKEWALRNHINPISYVAQGHPITKAYERVIEVTYNLKSTVDIHESRESLRYLLAFIKPLEGKMIVDNVEMHKVFYHESEWRFVPRNKDIEDFIEKSIYDDKNLLEEHNESTRKNCMLKFDVDDIKYIFVENDNNIPAVVNLIHDKMDGISSNKQKILYSRIISLESLGKDL